MRQQKAIRKQHFFCSDTWVQCKHFLFLMLSLCISSAAITQGVFMLLRLRYLLFTLSTHQLLQVFSFSWSAYGYVVLSLFLIALGSFAWCVAIYDGCRGGRPQQLSDIKTTDVDTNEHDVSKTIDHPAHHHLSKQKQTLVNNKEQDKGNIA